MPILIGGCERAFITWHPINYNKCGNRFDVMLPGTPKKIQGNMKALIIQDVVFIIDCWKTPGHMAALSSKDTLDNSFNALKRQLGIKEEKKKYLRTDGYKSLEAKFLYSKKNKPKAPTRFKKGSIYMRIIKVGNIHYYLAVEKESGSYSQNVKRYFNSFKLIK